MPFSPSPSSAVQRPDLGITLEEFDVASDKAGYIASKVLPIMDVALQTANIGRIPIEQLLKDVKTERAPGATYARTDTQFETFNFATVEHGIEEVVDKRQAKIFKRFFDAEVLAAKKAQGVILRNLEKRVADLVFNTTTWSTAALKTAVTNEWDDASNATPIADVKAARKRVRDNSGQIANSMIINWNTFQNLRGVAEIVDLIKYSGLDDPKGGKITEQVLAQVLDLEQIIVAGAMRNTAKENQNVSLADIWSNEYAMVCRISPDAGDPQTPTLGRIFGYTDDDAQPEGSVESYEEVQTRSTVVRVRNDTDELIYIVETGHLLENIIT